MDDWMLLRMKFSHRLIALFIAGCLFLVYLILMYAGYVPSIMRNEKRELQNFLAENPLVYNFHKDKIDVSQCRADFSSPKDVLTTLDIAEKTDFKVYSMSQYHIPHLKLEDAAYRKDLEPLNVIIVPHSHVDPGWLESLDEYYHHKVENILNNMVRKLHLHKDMTFIWAEVVFLSRWWAGIPEVIRDQTKELIKSGRLEIVLGGWVMPDEASTLYTSVIDQLVEGHQWVFENLGVKPKNSWSVDPFGHSGTMPYLWKKAGMSNMVIQRIHQGTKGALALGESLEFTWKQFWDESGSGNIRCHVMPYMLYSLHHTCGPDKFVCMMYDFKNIPGEIDYGPERKITEQNIAKKAQALFEQYRLKGSLYKHNTILIPLGDDFRYDHHEEWDQQYENYKMLMSYINAQKDWKMNIRFGTVKDYFETVKKEQAKKSSTLPTLSGDFFPYSDQNYVYWTGYYSTRPFDKRFSRDLEMRLRAAEVLSVLALSYSRHWKVPFKHFSKTVKLQQARQELGLFLHHDAITGTAKADVVLDYEERLFHAYKYAETAMEVATQFLLTKGKLDSESILQPEIIRDNLKAPSMHQLLTPKEDGIRVVMFNPTAQLRSELAEIMVTRFDFEIRNSKREIVPFQINPIFKSDVEVNREAFEIIFPVEIPPFGIETYIFETVKTPTKCYWSNIKVFNTEELIVSPELKFGQDRPRRRGNLYESIFLENDQIGLEFRSYNGLLKTMTDKITKNEMKVNLDFKYYTSRGSGAYIFFPDGPAKDLLQVTGIIRVIEGPYSAEIQSIHPYLFHKARLYKHPGLQGRNVYIQNGFDMQVVNMRDREVIMRFATGVKNELGSFFTDENGYQVIGRKKHPSNLKYNSIAPNYYPITTMAFIQDSQTRVTLHTGQPHGVASLDKGWLEVMIDRQLLYDDERGLGEGVYDNKLTLTKFVLQVEHSQEAQTEELFTFPSLQSIMVNDFLQQPLQKTYTEINSDVMSPNFSPMKHSLPCDTTIVALKTLFKPDSSYGSTGLIVHRRGYKCGFPVDGLQCSSQDISIKDLLPEISDKKVQETSLTHLDTLSSSVNLDNLEVAPMEIKSYLIELEPIIA